MYILISPAKTLDFSNYEKSALTTNPVFQKEADKIAGILKKLKAKDLANLMNISDDLAHLNYERYQQWDNLNSNQLKEAVFAFKGDVYQGLEALTFTEKQIVYAQNHLRILSGIYGILKPLDKIAPYRLEMGTTIKIGKNENLYEFWKSKIIGQISKEMKLLNTNSIINLASNEYFKSVNLKGKEFNVISPVFKDYKNGEYKIISFFAKKARGLMARYLINNSAMNEDILLGFQEDGYHYNPELSAPSKPVFTRG